MKKLKLYVKKLKAEMKRQGLTYQILGDMMGIRRQTVGYYIAHPNDLTLKTISKIARAINLDPKDLLI